ncbi:MAG: PEP-CTERM sorting domain-containing protein [Alishewanella agri]|nr:PEP-CTERM sorting domain-containing protein [Alishewanella agri]
MKTAITYFPALAMATLFCTSANAALISFNSVNASDGSGLVSSLVLNGNINNLVSSNVLDPNNPNFGLFIETFDSATKMSVFNGTGSTAYNTAVGNNNGCALNSTAGGVSITSSGNQAFAISQGTVSGVYAAPANDNTCFGFTPAPGGAVDAWVAIDYSNLLASFSANFGGTWRIDYLGFYWGSVDNYNDFMFYDTSINGIQGFSPFANQGTKNPFTSMLAGQSLLDQLGGTSGNQQSPTSNSYVNIEFAPDDAFTSLAIRTRGVAGEFDNIVVRVSQVSVPAPATLGLFGLGLLAAAGLRRRQK